MKGPSVGFIKQYLQTDWSYSPANKDVLKGGGSSMLLLRSSMVSLNSCLLIAEVRDKMYMTIAGSLGCKTDAAIKNIPEKSN